MNPAFSQNKKDQAVGIQGDMEGMSERHLETRHSRSGLSEVFFEGTQGIWAVRMY